MEGWKKKTKEVTTTVQDGVMETVTMIQEDGHQMNELEELETNARRLDSRGKERKQKVENPRRESILDWKVGESRRMTPSREKA